MKLTDIYTELNRILADVETGVIGTSTAQDKIKQLNRSAIVFGIQTKIAISINDLETLAESSTSYEDSYEPTTSY